MHLNFPEGGGEALSREAEKFSREAEKFSWEAVFFHGKPPRLTESLQSANIVILLSLVQVVQVVQVSFAKQCQHRWAPVEDGSLRHWRGKTRRIMLTFHNF